MPWKYTSDEKKVYILAWRQKKVSIKVICERSGRAKSTVMKLQADTKHFQAQIWQRKNKKDIMAH